MSIFNSLGSNYDFNFVLRSFYTFSGSSNNLKNMLEEKYGGKAILLYKGREAIELALKLLDLPKGSYVAINGFTCFAVYEAIKKAELNVEYLDIEKGQLNFSPEILKKKIKSNPKIKVVIVQNTLGYPCSIEKIKEICKENKIVLIEDLAHCVGTKYQDGTETGTVGDMTVLSFSQDKMIDGISGGALILRRTYKTNTHLEELPQKQEIIDKFYPFFTYLIRKSYSIGVGKILHFIIRKLNLLSKPMDGTNSNGPHELPTWYENLIKKQFENLENNLNHRKVIASIYARIINRKILSSQILKLIPYSSNLRFPIFVNARLGLINFLKKHDVYISDIWYDAPIAPKKYLKNTDYRIGMCPNSEVASDHILNLPTHINVSEIDAERISQLINQWLKLH